MFIDMFVSLSNLLRKEAQQSCPPRNFKDRVFRTVQNTVVTGVGNSRCFKLEANKSENFVLDYFEIVTQCPKLSYRIVGGTHSSCGRRTREVQYNNCLNVKRFQEFRAVTFRSYREQKGIFFFFFTDAT